MDLQNVLLITERTFDFWGGNLFMLSNYCSLQKKKKKKITHKKKKKECIFC